MKVRELIWSNRYAEAIVQLQQALVNNPEDMAAVEEMAYALRAKGEYGRPFPSSSDSGLTEEKTK